MKREWGGFTIIEVLIVLAVTSMLLVSGMLLFHGQIDRTQFNQIVRDTEASLQDIVNNISTGYYPDFSNVNCTNKGGVGSGIQFNNAAAKTLGTNGDCIFIGQVVLFSPQDFQDGLRILTVAGQRLVSSSPDKQTSTILEAKPKLLASGTSAVNAGPPGTTNYTDIDLSSGATIKWVKYAKNSTDALSDVAAVGFFTTFPGFDGTVGANLGNLSSGSTSTTLNAIQSIIAGTTALNTVRTVDFVENFDNYFYNSPPPTISPVAISNGSVVICLVSQASTKQVGKITIAGSSRQLKVSSIIQQGTDCI